MVAAMFGVIMARAFWAEDLKHAQELHQIWNRQEAAMASTIDSLQRTIKFKDETIAAYDKTIAAQDKMISILKGEHK